MKKLMRCMLPLAALALLLLVIPALADTVASGNCGAEGDNVTWTLDGDGVLTISGSGMMSDYDWGQTPWYSYFEDIREVNIITGVTSISTYAFTEFINLTSVTLPASITQIGECAFFGCNSLTSIIIPDSVTSIGENAFIFCDRLSSVTIPASVTSIGQGAFTYCPVLENFSVDENNSKYSSQDNVLFNKDKTVLIACSASKSGIYTIPGSVNRIEFAAFKGCSQLMEIVIPQSVTTIGMHAFESCFGLTNLTIPSSVSTIEGSLFNGDTSLSNFTVDSNNAYYSSEDNVLFNKNKTELIDYIDCKTGMYSIPDGVTTFGHAFDGCTGLTGITFPSSVTCIEDWAFDCCINLAEVTIPNSITYIGEHAFNECGMLTDVYYDGTEAQWNAITIAEGNEALASAEKHFAENPATIIASGNCGANGDNVTWTLDGDRVLTISGTGAMVDYSENSSWYTYRESILEVVIESGVTSIGSSAFKDCDSITGITIPQSVTAIGDRAFAGCVALAEITLPEGIMTIGAQAFIGCHALRSITIPAGVISIGQSAFSYTPNLTDIFVATDNATYSALDGVLLNKDQTMLIRYPSGKTSSAYSVPNTVTAICIESFFDCNNLTEIEIASQVAEIPEDAFRLCAKLTTVTIPYSVTIINRGAFFGCDSLTDINYPGTEEQWNAITIKQDNEPLASASKHFNIIPDAIIAFGDCGINGDNLTWTLDNHGILRISGSGAMANYGENLSPWFGCKNEILSLVIYDGVTSIGDQAFYECSNLYNVTLSTTIMSIGEWSFYACYSLENLSLPASLTVIKGFAFAECIGLRSLTVPAGVTSIGSGAFYWCHALTSIQVPEENTTYSSADGILFNKNKTKLFACPGGFIGAYTIPSSVTSIGIDAFYNCCVLTSLTIPSSVTTIEGGAQTFGYCESLTSIQVENDNVRYTSVDGVLFTKDMTTLIAYPNGLTGAYTIPDGVTCIESNAFAYCQGLTSITIHISVVTIEFDAFDGCAGLTDVYYGGTQDQWNQINIMEWNESLINAVMHFNGTDVPIIASGDCGANGSNVTWKLDENGLLTISGSGEMTNYYWSGQIPWAEYEEDIYQVIIETGVTSISSYAFAGCTALTDITIPNGVTSIKNDAFHSCISLTSVTIPNSVVSIEYYAFYNCTGLTSIILPGSITTIGNDAFFGCSSLTDITLPASLTDITYDVFGYCSSLTGITIPEHITNIASNAFRGCSCLAAFNVDSNNQAYASIDGVLYNKSLTELVLCPAMKTSVSIPESTTSIGYRAFDGCANLTSIQVEDGNSAYSSVDGVLYNPDQTELLRCPSGKTNVSFPNSVTTIGESAFAGCSALTSISLPDSVTSIQYSAFYGCSGLTAFTIPNGISVIESETFCDCTGLTSITIPASVGTVRSNAFYGCTGLVKVTFLGTNTYIYNSAFMFCSNPIFFCYPDSTAHNFCKNYNVPYSLMFDAYATDTDLRLPEGLTALEAEAFSGIPNGLSVYIPAGVTQIDRDVFEGVTGVTIYGVIGTEAETFAQEKGYPFVPTGIIE